MFRSCKLEIAQLVDPDKPQQQKWLHVTLQNAGRIDLDARRNSYPIEPLVKQCIRAYGLANIVDRGIFWGTWLLGINSLTGKEDDSYTIGTGTPQNQKFWMFLSAHRQLWFMQYSQMTGGGAMSMGKDPIDFAGSMTLRNAWISAKGVYPSGPLPAYFGPSEEPHGTGTLHSGVFNTFFSTNYHLWWSLIT